MKGKDLGGKKDRMPAMTAKKEGAQRRLRDKTMSDITEKGRENKKFTTQN